jgi:2'-5' RNA ligase
MFLGASPDAPATARLKELVEGLQTAWTHAAESLRWTPIENVHVTLHFLGELDDTAAARLLVALDEPLPVAPFQLTIGDLGVFPPQGHPRVIWLSVTEGRESLARVHGQLGERITRAGLAIESRPWAAHATIARSRDRGRNRERLRLDWSKHSATTVSWQLDHVSLFSSDLSGPVPRYHVMLRVPLDSRGARVPL